LKIVIDIECNALFNPTKVWVVVCKDLLTGGLHIFRNLVDDENERKRFIDFIDKCELIVGHNWLNYDNQVLERLIGYKTSIERVIDTLIISRLVDYPREGHSVEDYGLEFGLEKIKWHDYSVYSLDLEQYCIRDVEITYRIYKKYKRYIDNPLYKHSIELEHHFQCIVNDIENKGFKLDTNKVNKLLNKVTMELTSLDKSIGDAFPPRLKMIREVIPKETKYGTISLSSIPKSLRGDLSVYNIGSPFCYCAWTDFNPGSPKQVVTVLNEAGWKPIVKTKGHIETERELARSKHNKVDTPVNSLYDTLQKHKIYGWKINEDNLATLPAGCPPSAKLLAKRILHESRRKTLTEWISLVQEDGRVHGKFNGIGAWTHRMSHQKPNMANITNEFDTNGNVKLLGKELRQCWTVPKDRLLVGVDAEGIQLRIFAHYINDPEFTDALVKGKKDDKTDPHSLNKRILGNVCKTRQVAKRFIYALLLGAGLGKLAEILECSEAAAREALDRILQRYTGFAFLKETQIPQDAARGYFIGLDGRRVRIQGDTVSKRKHNCMSGYLQNGEAIVIKTAAVIADPLIKPYDAFFVDIIHDEYQVETPNDYKIAKEVATILCDSIVSAGNRLNLLCPLAGSYYNDDHHEYTIGRNWYETH
jgi:DNA polymerase-1